MNLTLLCLQHYAQGKNPNIETCDLATPIPLTTSLVVTKPADRFLKRTGGIDHKVNKQNDQ